MTKPALLLLVLILVGCNPTQHEEDHAHEPSAAKDHSHSPADGTTGEFLPKRIVPATDVSPEFVQLAHDVEIIPDIRKAVESVGVLTHEGSFGPLLFAERSRAFFIELKPGMFLSEHPHPTESIVYTVSGKWVLCSEGKRQVMEAGSLFHFGDNMPTGWEAPFAEGALLLVVKTREDGSDYEPYVQGLREMATDLDGQRRDGTPFYFSELEPDHEAIQFARSVNPEFDQVLSVRY
jgi:quercetin dioxygenase-like cupin family protein